MNYTGLQLTNNKSVLYCYDSITDRQMVQRKTKYKTQIVTNNQL